MRSFPLAALFALALTTSGCGAADVSSGVEVSSAEASRAEPDVVTDAGQPLPTTVIDGSAIVGSDGASDVPSGASTDGRPAMPATVAVVGDSLSLAAQVEIETALTALGLDVVGFDAVESRRIAKGSNNLAPGVAAIKKIRDLVEPELWVIALGTNDVGAEVSIDTFADDMEALLAGIPDDAPVMWVDTFIRQRADLAEAANAAIRSVIARRPGSHVVEWFVHGEEPGIVTIDGVHLSTRGQSRYAESIASAIEAAFAPS